MSDDGMWFFCLRHMRVEQGSGCADRHRMGPYETRDEAAQALDMADERNQEWRREDRAEE